MSIALGIAAAIGLIVAALLVFAAYFRWGNPGAALADWMLEAGGERTAYYRRLRMAGFAMFALGLCFSIWFVGRGTPTGETHSQQVAGVIALAFFGLAAIFFLLWWCLSGMKMSRE